MKSLLVTIFSALFVLGTALVLVQQHFRPFRLAGLQGAFEAGEMPELTASSYTKGSFQTQADHFLKYQMAFNGELVRLRNQLEYSLFGNINTILMLGKENYLFDPAYRDALEGNDLMSDSAFNETQKNLSEGVRILKERNIPLMVIFTPNKASYFSEYLNTPLSFANKTNKSEITSMLDQNDVHYIDFDSWFLSAKDTTRFPLMTKYGAHWSTYGAAIAGDSIINLMREISGDIPSSFKIKSVEFSDKARFGDDDYLPSLNLMKKWPSPPLAYPELEFIRGSKPNPLIITDSFIWNLYDLGIVQNCFGEKTSVHYYFKTVYDVNKQRIASTASGTGILNPDDFDFVIIITSDPSLKSFGFGFFEALTIRSL
jgi:hypothetical protein